MNNEKRIKSFFDLAKHRMFKAVSQGIENIITEKLPDSTVALGNKQDSGDEISATINGSIIVEDKDKLDANQRIEKALESIKSSIELRKAMNNDNI